MVKEAMGSHLKGVLPKWAFRPTRWGEATDEPCFPEQSGGSRGRSPHPTPFGQHALNS
jgi:hypothetical protein